MRFMKFCRGLAFVCCALLPCTTRAQGISLTASPMMAEVSARPGVQQTGIIALKHEAGARAEDKNRAPVHVRVYVMDWCLDPDGNPIFLKAGASGESCAAWVQVNPVELTIDAGATSQVRYTLSVPPDAQGTYRAMVMFETDAAPAQVRGQKVAVNGRLGCALYAQVGPQVRRARVTSFSLKDAYILLNVENTGTTHLRLRGQIEFRDAGGRLVAQTSLPGAVVLSGKDNRRAFRVSAPVLPPGVSLTMTATLDYGGDALLGARGHVLLP